MDWPVAGFTLTPAFSDVSQAPSIQCRAERSVAGQGLFFQPRGFVKYFHECRVLFRNKDEGTGPVSWW
jgi:hypothetical protein